MHVCYIMYYIIVLYVTTVVLYVTKYVHFNNEVFLEWSNGENLLRKILLLTIGNFYEGSIDHIIMNDLIKTTILKSIFFELLLFSRLTIRKSPESYCLTPWDRCNTTFMYGQVTEESRWIDWK